MCKTGKKKILNKINFNEFILLYWKMKKKINKYFLVVF